MQDLVSTPGLPSPETGRATPPSPVVRGVIKRGLQLLMTGLVLGLAMFVPAGHLAWWQAWALLGVYVGAIAFNALFLLRRDPALIAERAETKENTKGWDKLLTRGITLLTLLILVVAGLDVRFGWSRVPVAVTVAGLLAIVAGNAIVSWAMGANRFFARVVRIQTDRGHEVCSTGPYRFVRHPGYVGIIVYSLAMPIALGSLWAVIPALLVAVGFVARTVFEDRTLHAELAGYPEYAARVRFRLLPGIW